MRFHLNYPHSKHFCFTRAALTENIVVARSSFENKIHVYFVIVDAGWAGGYG